MVEKINFSKLYIFFCLLILLLLFACNWLLISEDLYYDTFGEQLSYEKINALITSSKKWQWVAYPLTSIFYLLKFLLIVTCLSIGTIFLKSEVKVKTLFNLALVSEFIFLAPLIIKLLWFNLFQPNFSIHDLQYFSPFSILSFFDPGEIDPWFVYPLHLLNVFELAYWVTLAYLLKDYINKSLFGSLKFVASTYGIGLFIWVLLITFLTVSIS